MLFSRADMKFVHYRWDTDEEPASLVYSGEPSRREFDPFNGNQVLFLINCYGEANGGITQREAHRMETMLAHELPETLRSERSVFNWIMESAGSTH